MPNKKKQIDWRIIVAGMTLLTVVEIVALFLGYNGTLVKSYMVMIGLTIGAFAIPLDKFIKNKQ